MEMMRIRDFILAMTLLLGPAMLWGQDLAEYKVSGIVKEAKSGRPLEFCKIYVTDSLGQQVRRTITLDDGIFRFSVKDGSYSVLFTNPARMWTWAKYSWR